MCVFFFFALIVYLDSIIWLWDVFVYFISLNESTLSFITDWKWPVLLHVLCDTSIDLNLTISSRKRVLGFLVKTV